MPHQPSSAPLLTTNKRSRQAASVFVSSDEHETDLVPLDPEQSKVLKWALEGISLFIGGAAGTGKSFLLRSIVKEFTRVGTSVAVTAMTGIASVNIEGTTFADRFGLRQKPKKDQGWFNPSALRFYDVAIIDEVSMLSAALLDRFDEECRAARQSHAPFGGLQIILCGDFLQLQFESDTLEVQSEPAFKAKSFKSLLAIALQTQHRQSVDQEYAEALARLRVGDPSRVAELFDRSEFVSNGESTADSTQTPLNHQEETIMLYPTRRAAELRNQAMLQLLPGPEQTYPLRTRLFTTDAGDTERRTLSITAPRGAKMAKRVEDAILSCCTKAQKAEISLLPVPKVTLQRYAARYVLTLPSLSDRALHRLQRKLTALGAQVQELQDGHYLSSIISHKSKLFKDLTNNDYLFATKTLKKGCRVMLLRNISPLLVNGTIGYVQDFVPMNDSLLPPDLRSQLRKRIFPSKPTTLLPLVKFSAYQHPVLIPEMSFHFTSARLPGRTLQASVMPLVAAYAFTVHKLQGVTLHQPVQLDCTSMWSCPHLIYVAASRVRKQSHFRMKGFQPSFVQISQEAYNFMKELPSVSEAEALYSGKQIVKPSLS